jgi:hypothetical protein
MLLAGAILADDQSCWIPQFIDCPDTLTMNHCDSISYRFEAVNPHSRKPDHRIRYHLVAGPGQIDSCTGVWTVGAAFAHSSSFDTLVEVSASRGRFATSDHENCRVLLKVVNRRSWITISGVSFNDTIDMHPYDLVRFPVAYGDSDVCDRVFVGASARSPLAATISPLGEGTGELVIESGAISEETVEVVTLLLHANAFLMTPHLYVRLHPRPLMTVRIANQRQAQLGESTDVAVTFDSDAQQIGGFNLLIAYEADTLTFLSAFPGPAFGPDGCGWEYFTYRSGAEGNCTGVCPSGLIRLVGLAETNNGPARPSCFTPDSLPTTLLSLRFYVTNKPALNCMTHPIRFYWLDCTDNVMTDPTGRELYLSATLADFWDSRYDISNRRAGFPTYLGAQAVCDTAPPPSMEQSVSRQIAFINGSIDLVCSDFDLTGDINLNGLAYEIDDYELFCRSFERGLSVFSINLNGQTEATDINRDAQVLSLTDLIALNRVIRGEVTVPVGPPRISPNISRVLNVASRGNTMVQSSDTLAALFLMFDGEVAPTVYGTGPEPRYYFDGLQTRVLVAPSAGDTMVIPSNYLLINTGEHQLLFAQATTKWGDSVVVNFASITDAPDEPGSLPTQFALRQNYPNPFNATTVISFDLPRVANVTLDIINVLGQRVFSRTAQYAQGSHQIVWEGTDDTGHPVASGMYYYRLSAGEFHATRKLMLLK